MIHSERHNTGATPTPAPTPDADQLVAAAAEHDLAAVLAGLAALASAPAAVKAWANAAASAHGAAAAVLDQVDPLAEASSSPAPIPPVAPASLAAGLATVASSSAVVAKAHEQRALAADPGPMTLLWASLMLTSLSQAVPSTAMTLRALHPHPFDAGTPLEARSVLVQQLNAAVQAYEVGIGVMTFKDPVRLRAEPRFAALQQMLVAQNTAMRSEGATPPPPDPGYRLPLRPTNAATASQLFALTERSLLNAFARQSAASPTTGRQAALTGLRSQLAWALQWGGSIQQWPGWA